MHSLHSLDALQLAVALDLKRRGTLDEVVAADRVVTAGQYRVQPGAPVQVATANSQMPLAKLDVTQQHVAQGAPQ